MSKKRNMCLCVALAGLLSGLALPLPCFSKDKSPQKNPLIKISTDQITGDGQNAAIYSGTRFQEILGDRNWWLQFNDPVLSGYIEDAFKFNRDLSLASLRIQEAQAWTQVIRAQSLPSVGIGADYARQRNSGTMTSLSNTQLLGTTLPQTLTPDQTFNIYQLPLSARYEPDIWRRNKQQVQAQQQAVEMSRYESLTLITAITTDIASTYFELAKNSQLLQWEEKNQAVCRDNLALAEARFKAGLASYEPVNQAKAACTESDSLLNYYQAQHDVLTHRLAVLCGKSAQDFQANQDAQLDMLASSVQPPQSIPAELILRRPDILQAEAAMAKAHLNVSVARKAFLPTIALTGRFGLASNGLADFLDWKSRVYTVGSQLMQSLMTGGKRRAELKIARLEAQQSIEQYQQTILSALQDVEDNMARLRQQQAELNHQQQLLMMAQDSLSLVQARQKQGLATGMEVNAAEQKLITQEKAQLESKARYLVSIVSLTRAMGGGLTN